MMTLFTNGVLVDNLVFTLTEIQKDLMGHDGMRVSVDGSEIWRENHRLDGAKTF